MAGIARNRYVFGCVRCKRGEENMLFDPSGAQWEKMPVEEKIRVLSEAPLAASARMFSALSHREQIELMSEMPEIDRCRWLNTLPLDEIADVLQTLDASERQEWLRRIPDRVRDEVAALAAYAEDVGGGLMNPRYLRVRPEMRAEEAIHYIRHQISQTKHTVYYAYVLDAQDHLMGIVSFRELLSATNDNLVRDFMHKEPLKVYENTPQSEIARIFRNTRYLAVPVVDSENRMKGIVTADDVVNVVEEEATRDIQRLGGTEVLDAPYMHVSFFEMFRKRVGWLAVLFVGEMFTATAMGYYEREIKKAVVLALFIPLIISSGGNSGSQASTLVVRALALGEVKLRDWWRVLYREIGMGVALGIVLGTMGFVRISLWPTATSLYGPYYLQVALAVALSIIGIILWGTIMGSLLPLLLRAAKLDPATACAPFVATMVDVSGLVIYFTVASVVLRGTIL
jgi:magnesium transporter